MNQKSNQNKLIRSFKQFNTSNNQLLQSNHKSKNSQNIKQIERTNEVEQVANRDKIKESVIKPIKIVNDNKDINSKMDDIEKTYMPALKTYWAGRTNQPYKGIIKDDKNSSKEFKTRDDLIVHRVTNADKNGVDNDLEEFKGSIEKHNDELKIIYSTTKRAEHKKKFEYTHKYKYRINNSSETHDEMKKDRISYYKHEQEKQEENKEKIDNIIENLVNQGVLDEIVGADEIAKTDDKKQKYVMRQKK